MYKRFTIEISHRDQFIIVNETSCILDTLPPLPPLPDTPLKTYVDPLIYVDVLDAVQEFTNEIDPESLSLEHLIGAGSLHRFVLKTYHLRNLLILFLTF